MKWFNEREILGSVKHAAFRRTCVCLYQEWKATVQRIHFTDFSIEMAAGRCTSLLDLFCSIISQHREVNLSHIFVAISVAEWTRSWSINFDLKVWKCLSVSNSVVWYSPAPLSNSIHFNGPCWSNRSHNDTEKDEEMPWHDWIWSHSKTDQCHKHTNGALIISDGSRRGIDLT